MNLSLNEVEATAKKAAKGAGYTWGLSEEAGKATRWLCCHGIDGCNALANLLTEFDGTKTHSKIADTHSHEWTAKKESICSLTMGASLSDFASSLEKTGLRMNQVSEPTLLLYFTAMVSIRRETPVCIEWSDNFAVTDGYSLHLNAPNKVSKSDVLIHFQCKLSPPNKTQSRAYPSLPIWQTLNIFASRTYAPATELSRLSGAGSGCANDN